MGEGGLLGLRGREADFGRSVRRRGSDGDGEGRDGDGDDDAWEWPLLPLHGYGWRRTSQRMIEIGRAHV